MDSKNMDKRDSARNDWVDDGDDNWADWGDADDFEEQENSTKAIAEKFSNNNTVNQELISEKDESKAEVDNSNKSSWGNVFGFGSVVSSVLSTATEGLGNITSTVSQGLNQVIGVPDPEELALINSAEIVAKSKEKSLNNVKNQAMENEADDGKKHQQALSSPPVFGLGLVSGVTTLGSKVLNTGLDTLEGIGKKTMTILQENDPLLMNKRKMLGLEPNKPNLSEILKEAKKDADQLENTLKEMQIEKSREMLRFEFLFENNCGLVHLEALEILSRESKMKLQKLLESVSGNALIELQETIKEVEELMELEDLDGESEGDYDANELNKKLLAALEDADLQITFDDIVANWSQSLAWMSTITACSEKNYDQEAFAKGITVLAETCALEMNKLHKIAELLLVKDHHSTANEVDSIVQLCKQFNIHLNGLTNRFAVTLSARDSEEIKANISTLYAEMLVAIQHIETAFKLFLPILQIGAV